MAKKIALIVTYFGELPFYFPAFQLSCKYNPDIQWFIFTDCEPPPNIPDNVNFINFSIEDFCRLASRKLGFSVRISREFLYKICDFKPTFGMVYEDYLREYDFWGHCDVDIVWGRITHFIDSEILNNYDVISSRPERISGHFCLYRNIEKINKIFLSMPVTVKLLKRIDTCERLDEVHFSSYLHWLQKPTLLSRIKQFVCGKPFVPEIYWNKVLTVSGKHQRELYKKRDSFLKWKQGKVYHIDGTEMMYLHFHILKKTLNAIDFNYAYNPEEFIITTNKII